MSEFNIDELLKQIKELEYELKAVKKYGLVWDKENTKEEVVLKCENNIPILKEDKTKKLVFGTDNNILIEGDNYHALSSLLFVYQDSIDVIYIDPPYNTGREDFVYNDNYVNDDDGYFHSKWLSFMSKRLSLARSLLKDTGVIFISIDDNEQANLKLLCDQIFGSRNFVTNFCVIRSEGGGMAKQVVKGHDYCLVYAKNISKFRPLGKPKDVRGKIVERDGVQYWIQEDWLRKEFGKYGNCHYEELIQYKGEEYKAEIDEGLKNGKYVLIKKDTGLHVIGKLRRLDEDSSKFYSIIKHLNKDGVNELKEMGINFDYPKPVSLIKELVYGATMFNKNALILDFFAGSGTTGQAVLEINSQYGGKRRFILCTNNENNICTDVTYPRLKAVITGKKPNGQKHSNGIPANLYYFKTDFIKDESNVEQAKYSLVEKVDSLLCISENILNEVERNDYSAHFIDGDRHLFIYNEYFNERKFAEFKKRVETAKGKKIVYVFSSDNEIDPSLISGKDMVVKPIPSKIYEIYKEIAESIKRGE